MTSIDRASQQIDSQYPLSDPSMLYAVGEAFDAWIRARPGTVATDVLRLALSAVCRSWWTRFYPMWLRGNWTREQCLRYALMLHERRDGGRLCWVGGLQFLLDPPNDIPTAVSELCSDAAIPRSVRPEMAELIPRLLDVLPMWLAAKSRAFIFRYHPSDRAALRALPYESDSVSTRHTLVMWGGHGSRDIMRIAMDFVRMSLHRRDVANMQLGEYAESRTCATQAMLQLHGYATILCPSIGQMASLIATTRLFISRTPLSAPVYVIGEAMGASDGEVRLRALTSITAGYPGLLHLDRALRAFDSDGVDSDADVPLARSMAEILVRCMPGTRAWAAEPFDDCQFAIRLYP